MERAYLIVLFCCHSQWSSLVSKCQKAHPRVKLVSQAIRIFLRERKIRMACETSVKRRTMVIFLYFCGPSLTSYG